MIKLLFILISLSSLNACDYFQRNRMVDLKVTASQNLNPDLNERPSPVVLGFYELTDKIPFKSLGFSKISYQSYQNLKTTLIDYSTIEVRPSEIKNRLIKLHHNTAYLGIVAAYRQLDNSRWKQLIELPNNKNHMHINIRLTQTKMSAKIKN